MKIELLKITEQEFGPAHEKNLKKLPAERQIKTKNYRRNQDKLMSFWAGMLIREEFGNRVVSFGSFGKPCIAGQTDYHFSLSHDWPYVLFAVSESGIGVDIERKRGRKTGLAKQFFTENEYRIIEASRDPEESFYKVWTGKEAFFKMKGTGLTIPLDSMDVFREFEKGHIVWKSAEDYTLAICSEEHLFQIQVTMLKTDDFFSGDCMA